MVKVEAKSYIDEFKRVLESVDLSDLDKILQLLRDARADGKQIFIIGNGGSAAIASHFACDLGKGTVKDHKDETEKRFKAISLTDNNATLTAYANDLGYEHVFSEQLKNLLNENDVLIAISSSGKSKNVLNAAELAKKMGAKVIGLVGFDGGQLKDLADLKVWVKKDNYGMVEDTHSILQHMICSMLRG